MIIDDRLVTVPYAGGSFTCRVPEPVADELARLAAKREQANDMIDRLLTRLEQRLSDKACAERGDTMTSTGRELDDAR